MVAPRLPELPGDANRLQQVVWNVLSNAVKFTPRGGRIDVRVAQDADDIQIVVSDTGIGFPDSFKPHVFERFRQAESGPTRLHGGLGLGLAIARHIVETARRHDRRRERRRGPGAQPSAWCCRSAPCLRHGCRARRVQWGRCARRSFCLRVNRFSAYSRFSASLREPHDSE